MSKIPPQFLAKGKAPLGMKNPKAGDNKQEAPKSKEKVPFKKMKGGKPVVKIAIAVGKKPKGFKCGGEVKK